MSMSCVDRPSMEKDAQGCWLLPSAGSCHAGNLCILLVACRACLLPFQKVTYAPPLSEACYNNLRETLGILLACKKASMTIAGSAWRAACPASSIN